MNNSIKFPIIMVFFISHNNFFIYIKCNIKIEKLKYNKNIKLKKELFLSKFTIYKSSI
jgi:hypothetical protein